MRLDDLHKELRGRHEEHGAGLVLEEPIHDGTPEREREAVEGLRIDGGQLREHGDGRDAELGEQLLDLARRVLARSADDGTLGRSLWWRVRTGRENVAEGLGERHQVRQELRVELLELVGQRRGLHVLAHVVHLRHGASTVHSRIRMSTGADIHDNHYRDAESYVAKTAV